MGKKEKKDPITDFEKWEMEQYQRIERERAKFISPEARTIRERRQKQAEVLWQMYRRGELVRQTLEIPIKGGGICRREVLYSHESKYAV